jgi:uncharacterized membrane protein
MPLLRYIMLLSLIVWLGGIIFFSCVLAPTAFSVVPPRQAGLIVSRSLSALHWIGIVSGIVLLTTSMLSCRLHAGSAQLLAPRHILLYIMLGLSLISQFVISPRMATLRASMPDTNSVATTDPVRVQFNALHAWSTRLEGGVLLLGLVVVYLTAQQLSGG